MNTVPEVAKILRMGHGRNFEIGPLNSSAEVGKVRMAGDTQSKQEALMKISCERAMSAPFVFCPDVWMKGHHTREPADLVWACNSCVILMYMTESQGFGTAEENRKRFKKAEGHNLSQAKGWMRHWKHQSLKGKNAFRSFSIDYARAANVIILSVVKTGRALLKVHAELSKTLGVKYCATIPQSVLEHLVVLGGSPLDLIVVLERFRGLGEITEVRAHEELRAYRDECWQVAKRELEEGGLSPVPDHVMATQISLIVLALTKIRGQKGDIAAPVPPEELEDKIGMLSDIALGDFFAIARTLAVSYGECLAGGQPVESVLALPHYDCGIYVVPDWERLTTTEEVTKQWAKDRLSGKMRPGLSLILCCKVLRPGHFHLFADTSPRSGPSHTEQVLGTIA